MSSNTDLKLTKFIANIRSMNGDQRNLLLKALADKDAVNPEELYYHTASHKEIKEILNKRKN